ncbi:MAG: hypothetical protein ACTSWL_08065 [Promethearchaeota archaeon]
MSENEENFGDKNYKIVEQAKKAFSDARYQTAIELFKQSVEICESQMWKDGVQYAKGMIADAEELLNIQKEEQQFIAHEEEQEIEEELISKIPEKEEEKEPKEIPTHQEEPIAEKVPSPIIEPKSEGIPIIPIQPKPEEIPSTPSQAEPEEIPSTPIQPKSDKVPESSESHDYSFVLVQKGAGRLQCPKCGNNVRTMIREVEDKGNIIMDYPLLYGKKFICGKCGAHWRREE